MTVRVGVDVGGTFTDLALLDTKTGEVSVSKSPSTPDDPIVGIRNVLLGTGVGIDKMDDVVHGTTVGTNALLERRRQYPGLICTKGFKDVVFIQRMNRKHHYDLTWNKPQPYVERRHCFEVDERCTSEGDVTVPLNEVEARESVRKLKQAGIVDIAVCFLFSYLNPDHELRMREIIEEEYPEASVSLSHEVFSQWREYDRMSTTLADAYLKTMVGEYIENVSSGLEEADFDGNFLVMKSNGGLVDHQAVAQKPVDLMVSGPVGGVLSALYFGRLTGRENLISMDMGGTSFDVSLVAEGEANRTNEFEIEWGLPVYTPMVDVKTIGAGGGSIAWIDKGGLLRVGPRSAGASPGPVSYGRGGTEPTVTDANVVLGRINPDNFLGGDMQLDREAARQALAGLGRELDMEVEEVAASILDLVNFNMVDAIRLVSIDRGLDPREFSLVSFGGACSLHAGALAEIIGATDVLIPVHQGVFSAFGLMTADMRVDESVTHTFRSDLIDFDRFNEAIVRLRERALKKIAEEGYDREPTILTTVELRYYGQNYNTDIPLALNDGKFGEAELEETLRRFAAEHHRLYGYEMPEEPVECVNLKITAIGEVDSPDLKALEVEGDGEPSGRREVYFRDGGWREVDVYQRSALPPQKVVEGPAVIEETMSTTLVHPEHKVVVDQWGNLSMSRKEDQS